MHESASLFEGSQYLLHPRSDFLLHELLDCVLQLDVRASVPVELLFALGIAEPVLLSLVRWLFWGVAFAAVGTTTRGEIGLLYWSDWLRRCHSSELRIAGGPNTE